LLETGKDSPYGTVDEPADPLDIMALAMALWNRKWLLLLFLGVAMLVAAAYLNLATYRYTAKMQLTAAEQSTGKVSSGLAGLGSIVGVDIGTDSGSSFALFGEAVKSEAVAQRLAQDERIMKGIFSAHWDAEREQWREPPSPVRAITRPVKGLLGIPDKPWEKPGSGELRDVLQARLIVGEDKKKGLTTLSFEHKDGELARYLIESASREADSFLRAKSLARANDYVVYLERRLEESQVAEYRLSLAQALTSYENMRMMASADSAFAAEPFGPSIVSQRPTSPQPLVVLLTAMLAAVLLWAGYVLLLAPLLAKRRATKAAEA
jgi:uncharacterized protein involved in exopolysaccharide biosynthesis